jgi:DNA-binding transcriptional LysR family regulator
MVCQVATAGIGAAIVPTFLAKQELDLSALVPLFTPHVNDRRGDYLVYPIERATYPPVMAFRDWIVAEFAREK